VRLVPEKPGRKRRIPFGMTSFQPTAVSFCGFVEKKYKISHMGMGRKTDSMSLPLLQECVTYHEKILNIQ